MLVILFTVLCAAAAAPTWHKGIQTRLLCHQVELPQASQARKLPLHFSSPACCNHLVQVLQVRKMLPLPALVFLFAHGNRQLR
jgi:hypothetical protein